MRSLFSILAEHHGSVAEDANMNLEVTIPQNGNRIGNALFGLRIMSDTSQGRIACAHMSESQLALVATEECATTGSTQELRKAQ